MFLFTTFLAALRRALLVLAVLFTALTQTQLAHAEYADVVINFPHWFHRIRFACKVCHADLGFKFKAGGNEINMVKIIDGQYCGACHNGNIAWSVENCDLCHSGKPGTPTQVHESTINALVAPKTK
jgi:c(7)-type cytochrome triheme protein